jgi:tetratricopeptide (TPR) repeat protein
VIRPSRRAVTLAAAAVLVVALLASGGWLWYSAGQNRAMAAHAEALMQAGAAASPEARLAAIRSLEATLGQYPAAAAAAQAAYQLGSLRYDAGDYPGARAAYEIAVAKAPPPTIRALASIGIGQAWEAERNFPKAIEAYRAALTPMGPRDFLFEELVVSLARAEELAGRRDDAIASYRRLLKEVPDSRRNDEIRSRLARLGVSAP